jgi:hypothetical protein
MRMLIPFLTLAALAIAPGPSSAAAPPPASCSISDEQQTCCKRCRKGKPCGDTCIARHKTCNTPRGCACAV